MRISSGSGWPLSFDMVDWMKENEMILTVPDVTPVQQVVALITALDRSNYTFIDIQQNSTIGGTATVRILFRKREQVK